MVHAKKSLGQNFLNSKSVARDIVRAGELLPTDTILEIGPGKGFLTQELLASGAHVVAIEKDDRMIPVLTEKFAEEIKQGQFVLVHGDILEFVDQGRPLAKILKGDPSCSYKLVANIPYYLTGQIIRMFLDAGEKPQKMILMVQKEVAVRIVARPSTRVARAGERKESILSIAVKAYGTPKLIKKVPARYFTPAPKVDSAILAIENISNTNFPNPATEKRFFEILHIGFAHKRKMLAGNLKDIFGDATAQILKEVGIPANARAENVSLEQWVALTLKFPPLK